MISVRRVYEEPRSHEGHRVLVERLWPRGIKKDKLPLDEWRKDVAPSTELRQWFGHEPERWEEFRKRYLAELSDHPETWQPLLEEACRGDLTLLYSARDESHNSAVVLHDYLDQRLSLAREKGACPS